MLYTIRDNHANGKVGDYLKSEITPDSEISIVSAYFTIYAYEALKDNLDKIKSLKFLFGKPTFVRGMDPNVYNPRDYKIEDDGLVINSSSRLSQKSIALDCAKWLKEKAEIRSIVKPNFLHGKMYFIKQPGIPGQEAPMRAITGSSNFTVNGLGLGGSPNIELNKLVDSDRDRLEIKSWFDSIWNDDTGLVQDVKDDVLKYLATLYSENAPEFVYYKTLYHVFEDYLKDQSRSGLLNEATGFFDSKIWNSLYSFQKDGVKAAINKIIRHNGCILADSVGLGKTYEALAVIKYFQLLNNRILVLTPRKLSANWTVFQATQNHALNPFMEDRFDYTVLYHTDVGRTSGNSDANGINLENFNWGNYDLVVIDESHNFRGNPKETVNDDGKLKMNRGQWLLKKIIQSGVNTKVLLLSATPVNNNLKDLRNQIAYITGGRDDAMAQSSQIQSIAQTLKNAQTKFTNWAHPDNKDRNLKTLIEQLDSSFFKLLDELTIARSRKHITSFYNDSTIGKFPDRLKPVSEYPNIDSKKRFPSYDKINKDIMGYALSLFNPSKYVKKDKQSKYADAAPHINFNFTQEKREHYLIGMMKVNFLKRLESSIESFEISMDRTIQKIEKLMSKIEEFKKKKGTKVSNELNFELFAPDEDEMEEDSDETEDWQVGKKLKFDLADLNLDAWLKDLQQDKDALLGLYNSAKSVAPEDDAKLKRLKEIIKGKANTPFNKGNKKIIIFTAFTDTAKYLYQHLKDYTKTELKLHTALVTGTETHTTYGKNDFESILVNFSPVAKKRTELRGKDAATEPEIDILVATDCISEGQNLQDCDFLINYDIHWNPVRIIQRFGRIDRLGSKNASIQLLNFWPTKDLDNYINLKHRVESRMALVDVTATGEDNLLTNDQIEELITEDFKYRNQQLKRLQNEILDIEEMGETISLSDFNLDDYRIDLFNYIEANRKQLQDAPMGLYGIVPSPSGAHAGLVKGWNYTASEKEIIRPGFIFCLAHKTVQNENRAINPLYPFYLIYIRNDGAVRYNYTHAKHVLEIFRLLSHGRKEAYMELVDLFNKETDNGKKMDAVVELLKKSVTAITGVNTERNHSQLFAGRGGKIIAREQQATNLSDFELVTWLVIK